MPKTLSIAEAQSDFPQVVEDVCNGEDIIIARENRPILRMVSLVPKFPTPMSEVLRRRRMEKWTEIVAGIKEVRKRAVIGPPITIEEIISARNEGRK